MKVQNQVNKLLKNEIVLYVISIIAISNLIFYLFNQNIEELVVFSIFGYITSLYTKNMSIILAVSILGTNLISMYNNYYMKLRVRNQVEGMENREKKDNKKKGSEENDEDEELPGPNDEEVSDDEEDEIDIVNTQKENFADISKVLGKNGLKNLTKETKELISQQSSLMETFKEMTPMIKTAQEAMKDMGSLDFKGLGNLTNLSGSLSKMMGGK